MNAGDANLAAQVELLAAATGSIPWTADPSGSFSEPQPRWAAFTGQLADAYCGRGWLTAVHPSDLPLTTGGLEEALRAGAPFTLSHRLRRADGAWRDMSVHCQPISDLPATERGGAPVAGWVGAHVDVTERGDLRERLAEATARADAAERVRRRFLANMSHDLRTPLSAVIGYSEMLAEELEGVAQSGMRRDLERIGANARQVLMLINDMLDLSAIAANDVTIKVAEVKVGALVGEVAETVRDTLASRNNALVVQVADDAGVMLTDGERLRQCLRDLVSAASALTEHGTIRLTARREAKPEGDWIALAVQDDGIGMGREQIEALLRGAADANSARVVGGRSRFGLLITRGMAGLLGGDVDVASAYGVGSTFTLSLPAVFHPPAPAAGGFEA